MLEIFVRGDVMCNKKIVVVIILGFPHRKKYTENTARAHKYKTL